MSGGSDRLYLTYLTASSGNIDYLFSKASTGFHIPIFVLLNQLLYRYIGIVNCKGQNKSHLAEHGVHA
jgi:hypothetical protein